MKYSNYIHIHVYVYRPYWLAIPREMRTQQTHNRICVMPPLVQYKTALCAIYIFYGKGQLLAVPNYLLTKST